MKGVRIADQIRTRWRHVARQCNTNRSEKSRLVGPNVQLQQSPTSPLDSPRSGTTMRRSYYSTPEGLVRLHKQESSSSYSLAQRVAYCSGGDSSGLSTPGEPYSPRRLRSYSLSVRDSRFRQQAESAMFWDVATGSVDSVFTAADVSELSRLIRDCSVDSDGSDFSLDVPLPNEGCGLSTLRVIQRIEEEINSLKNNCLAMNQELDTLRDEQAATPDMAQLSPAIGVQLSRASFKGLLNLTVIPDEICSDSASDVSDHHQHFIHGRLGRDRLGNRLFLILFPVSVRMILSPWSGTMRTCRRRRGLFPVRKRHHHRHPFIQASIITRRPRAEPVYFSPS